MADVLQCRRRVETVLGQIVQGPLVQDQNGNWPFPFGSAQVVVNVTQLHPAVPPVVIVASEMARVAKTPELLNALNDINAQQAAFARVYWVNGSVIVSAELVAETIDVPELSIAISQVAQIADGFDEALQQIGGGATFGFGAAVANPGAVTPVGSPPPMGAPAIPPPPPGEPSPLVGSAQRQSSPSQGRTE